MAFAIDMSISYYKENFFKREIFPFSCVIACFLSDIDPLYFVDILTHIEI